MVHVYIHVHVHCTCNVHVCNTYYTCIHSTVYMYVQCRCMHAWYMYTMYIVHVCNTYMYYTCIHVCMCIADKFKRRSIRTTEYTAFRILMCIRMKYSVCCINSQALTAVSTVSVQHAPWPSDSMVHIASLLLEYSADPNTQDCDGCSPLHRAVQCGNADVFSVLLSSDK